MDFAKQTQVQLSGVASSRSTRDARRRSPSASVESAGSFASGSDTNCSVNTASQLEVPARKRARAARTANGPSSLTVGPSRTSKAKTSSRYFASATQDVSARQASRRDNVSPVPVEDAKTGFLAFGEDEQSDDTTSIGSRSDTEEDGSSSADNHLEPIAAEEPDTKRRTQEVSSPPLHLKSRTPSPDTVPVDGPARRLGPTIPYSHFHPQMNFNCLLHTQTAAQTQADGYTFGMRLGESLTFIGIGLVEVLKGKLQVGGAILCSIGSKDGISSARVFAPVCHPLPLLKAVESAEQLSQMEQFPETFPVGSFATIVRISPFRSSIVDITHVCGVGGTASLFAIPTNMPTLKLPSLSTLRMLFEPDATSMTGQQQFLMDHRATFLAGLSATYIPHTWQTALHQLTASVRAAAIDPQEEAVVALVRGPKKVGKSTFSRLVLENILTLGQQMGGKVAFLELDLGQSDFGPPGMISLHVFDIADPLTVGPGWVQPRVPIKAHFIGDVSPKDDPSSYVAAIRDLINFFRHELQSTTADGVRMPLVINTQGWVKGLGADLASHNEAVLCPTHIYDVVPRGSLTHVPNPVRGPAWLDSEGAIVSAGPEIVTLESVNQVGFVPGVFNSKHVEPQSLTTDATGPGDGGSIPPPYITDSPSRLTPADLRTLSTLSYLYAQGLDENANNVAWNFSRPLVEAHPLLVDVEAGLKAGIQVLKFGSSIPDTFKLAALNGAIVGIVAGVQSPEQIVTSDLNELTRAKSIWKQAFRPRISANASVSSSRCLGLGIVRSIDLLRAELHILTPLSTSFLASFPALGLVKGALELPVWASLDFDGIRDAKESKLDVAPATLTSILSDVQPTLAGMARNQVPYVEWPWTPPPVRDCPSSHGHAHASNGTALEAPQRLQNNALANLGSQKRKIRRNLMRKGQFT